MEVKLTNLTNSEIELEGEIALADFEAKRDAALKRLQAEVKIDGFRDGHVPEAVLESKLGTERVLLEMAELALSEWYPKIVKEKSLDVIGRPEITITKIAKGNPLGFKIKTALAPKLALPDYKNVAKESNKKNKDEKEPEVTDDEVKKVLENVTKSQEGSKDAKIPTEEEIRKYLVSEKTRKAHEKRRLSLIDALVEASKVEIPPILIENELEKMIHEMKNDIASMGLKFEDYLKHLKKSEEDLKKDWQEGAKKRIISSLVLTEVGIKENIKATEEEIEPHLETLQMEHKDADPLRLRVYLENAIASEKTLQFLESLV